MSEAVEKNTPSFMYMREDPRYILTINGTTRDVVCGISIERIIIAIDFFNDFLL